MKIGPCGWLMVTLGAGGAALAAGSAPPTQVLPVISFRSDLGTNRLDPTAQTKYNRALQSFRERRYANAYGLLVELADAGHLPSARIALTMLHHGRALFGSDWSASAEQQQYWTSLVTNRALNGIEIVDNERGD